MSTKTINSFPPVEKTAWETRVIAESKSALEALSSETPDELRVLPLYVGSRSRSNQAYFPAHCTRGQRYSASTDIETIRLDAVKGVEHATIRVNSAKISAKEVGEKVVLSSSVGGQSDPISAAILGLAVNDFTSEKVVVTLDPIGALASEGCLPAKMDDVWKMTAEIMKFAAKEDLSLKLLLSSSPYHRAGATNFQTLGCLLATSIECVRALEKFGIDAEQTLQAVEFEVSIGRELFSEIAKIRALRRLWARIVEVFQVPKINISISAQSASRTRSKRDPWVNMLRGTTEAFAAIVGGADRVEIASFDAGNSKLGRRVARNTPTILELESHLGFVKDPAGGSEYIETLTDKIAENAWLFMQKIEAENGIIATLKNDWLLQEINTIWEKRTKKVAKRKETIVGVSLYPNLIEKKISTATKSTVAKFKISQKVKNIQNADELFFQMLSSAKKGATLGALNEMWATKENISLSAMPNRRLASAFETLRDRAEAITEKRKTPPSAFIASVGPLAKLKARAAFARGVMEVAGIQTFAAEEAFDSIEKASERFVAQKTDFVVIVGTNANYPELVPAFSKELHKEGAVAVVVAGRPPKNETWKGVRHFAYLGANIEEIGDDLLSLLEKTIKKEEKI